MDTEPDLLSERLLLDQLLDEARLYTSGIEYRKLLDFVSQLRNFAPFNALLLQIQKPGLSYAASAFDWETRFNRTIRPGARPLLILWPFGPVALVYDVQDTEGDPLPSSVTSFNAQGDVTEAQMANYKQSIHKKGIAWNAVDAGDRLAGSISVLERSREAGVRSRYRININRNHALPTQFATLAHELGHLYLGHLGGDKHLKIGDRTGLPLKQQELEAESVAHIICTRFGVKNDSAGYLSSFVGKDASSDRVDLYQVTRAAGQIAHLFEAPQKTPESLAILPAVQQASFDFSG